MSYVVYILHSNKLDRYYVGMTENVEVRLSQHNKGMTFSTKGFRPWRLFFVEEYNTRKEARIREKYSKSGVCKVFIKRKWSGSSAE